MSENKTELAGPAIAPINKTIDVTRSTQDAYDFFVGHFSDWWPLAKHSVSAMREDRQPVSITLEAKAGGRIFEQDDAGTEIEWGLVKVAAPGDRLVMSWHPGQGADEATEVEFRFVATGPDTCRVEMEHRDWHKLSENGQSMRDGYAPGWDFVLKQLSNAYASG
ncbi:MAG: SRPBCC domain-containing protein [Alphaproteobacteria bacterium]